jgi:hypothetical protein
MEDAFVGDCAAALTFAQRALSLDRSPATVPNAALGMALCGGGQAATKELERVATDSPTNTLVNAVYLPEVKAAAAISQRQYDEVPKLLDGTTQYAQISKVPQLLGMASLAMHNPQQAANDFKLGLRYRAVGLQEAAGGTPQDPVYPLCLLGLARAQAQFDKPGAVADYQKLVELWKNADADFQLAVDARKELAALTK